MGDGTLSREAYKTYMIQDYLYLVCRSSGASYATTDISLDSICPGQRSGKLQIYIA